VLVGRLVNLFKYSVYFYIFNRASFFNRAFYCFRALLFGGLKESLEANREIELKDTPARGFSSLLKYIYTGRICLSDLKVLKSEGLHVYIN